MTNLGKSSSIDLSQLCLHHLIELRESSIDDGIIALNFRSLSGDEPKDYLFCRLSKNKRLNNGRVDSSTLNKFRNTEAGGFWISGLNPHNHWQLWDYGRFKPDNPVINPENNKPIKYLSPPNGGHHPIYLDVPDYIWDQVAKRYNIKRYHSPLSERLADLRLTGGESPSAALGLRRSLSDCLRGGIKPVASLPKNHQPQSQIVPANKTPYCFWSWIQAHPEIPLILTEGEKKAACLLSLGFVAISVSGIWMGRKKDEATNTHHLHPDLLPMASQERKIFILFDNDPKPATKAWVNKAIRLTGEAIQEVGATCEVALLPDDSPKGVDDFVTAQGGAAAANLIEQLLEAAHSLEDFIRSIHPKGWGLSSKYPANLQVNNSKLGKEIKRLPESGLVVLWSGMGTGKTYLMEKWRKQHPKARFLNIGHRVNLLQNQAERLKTKIYSEITTESLAQIEQLSITLDSLYKLQKDLAKYDCVFIDEACQNLVHLLHSNTCKEHRLEIFTILKSIVRQAKLVVLADAHMDDLTVTFFRKMRPEGEVPFVIQNDCLPKHRDVLLYRGNDSSALVEKIILATTLGLKIMVVSDSKTFIKKVEELLVVEQGERVKVTENQDSSSQKLRFWSIHGDNSGSEENKTFIKEITASVENVDALLASPSLGTGVDIKGERFDAVFGAFHATTQSATECAQQLHRYRKNVPLHLWIAPRPLGGYQETNWEKIKAGVLQANEISAALLLLNVELDKRGQEEDWVLDTYCQIQAKRNRSINNLREDLEALLYEMGYTLKTVSAESSQTAKEQFKEAGQRLSLARSWAIVSASDISEQEYQNRQAKDYLAPQEEIECERYRIATFYGQEVTQELIEKDNDGRLYNRLLNLEAVCADSQGRVIHPVTGVSLPAPSFLVAQRDFNEREKFAFSPDWHNYSTQWLALKILGFPELLTRLVAGEQICATDPALVKMTQQAIDTRKQIKVLLNLTVPQNCKPLWLMGILLDRVGLKTLSHKEGGRGQQVTYRHLCFDTFEFALGVLQYRYEQRESKNTRRRQLLEDSLLYQLGLQTQYGIEPPQTAVSTPLQKWYLHTLEGGEDTNDHIEESMFYNPPLETWEVLSPYFQKLERLVDFSVEIIKRLAVKITEQTTWVRKLFYFFLEQNSLVFT